MWTDSTGEFESKSHLQHSEKQTVIILGSTQEMLRISGAELQE